MPPIDGLQLIAPERVEVVREQQGLRAHARTGQRRLGAGMAATDHNDIKTVEAPPQRQEAPSILPRMTISSKFQTMTTHPAKA
jgi:hypothetical protein